MIYQNPPLFSILPQFIPSQIQDDYPLFVQFFQAYYRWLQEKNRPRWIITQNFNDIDAVDAAFLTYFQNEFLQNIPTNNVAIPNLIKVIKQFYRSKGTTESFDTLFRILGDSTANVISLSSLEPITETVWQIIVPSNGIDDSFLTGYEVGKTLRGVSSGSWGRLVSSSMTSYTVNSITSNYVVLILDNVHGSFASGELLAPNNGVAFVPNYVIQSQITDVNIATSTQGNYSYSDSVNILNFNNQTAQLAIGQLGSSGQIRKIQIVNGGVGYITPPGISINSQHGFGLSATTILGGASQLQTFNNSTIELLTFMIQTTLDAKVYSTAVEKLLHPAGTMIAAANKEQSSVTAHVSLSSTTQPYGGIVVQQTNLSSTAANIYEAITPTQLSVRYATLGALSYLNLSVADADRMSPAAFDAMTIYGDSFVLNDVISVGNALYVSSSSSTSLTFDSYGGMQIEKVSDKILAFADRTPNGGTTSDGDVGNWLLLNITEDSSGNPLSQSSRTIHQIYGIL